MAARRTKVWVLTITQGYAAALVEMEKLAKNIAAENRAVEKQSTQQSPPAPEANESSAAEFLGRVMGFIDGPAARGVAAHVRADYRKRLVATLSTADRQLFEQAYNTVQKRFAELSLDREQTQADAKADQQKRQEQVQKELERDRAAVAQQKSSLQARSEKLADNVKQEVADLDGQARPLVTRQTRLEAQGAAITREMAGLEVEIARLLELSDISEDNTEAFELRAAAQRLSVALGRYNVDLRAINAELATLAAQRVQLAARRQAAIERNRAETDQVERRLSDLRTADRRISTEEKKANQPFGGNTAAVVAMAAKARAFTTYEPFPFEEERARLLQSLGK
jgi:chromosome segregation ATPase